MRRKLSSLYGLITTWGLSIVLLAALPASATATDEKKGLFYYVVDQSASIIGYGLTEPIRDAITSHAADLPEDTEVRLVFFSRRASEPHRWVEMTPDAKTHFSNYFINNFRPHGSTRLYDTVAEVLEELHAAPDDYQFVSVLVFSDGEDNVSRNFRSWENIEPLYEQLQQRHESFIYWITLEFEPAEAPPSWVHHDPQPPGTTDIPIPEPPPEAQFTAFPRHLEVGETVQFEHEATGGRAETFHWDFGDGNTSGERNPAHQYEEDGAYTVTLHTQGPGGEAEQVQEDFIEVAPDVPLVAKFRYAPDRPQTGDTLRLQDLSEGEPDEREWLLDGESFSTDAAPSIPLEETGELTLALRVKRGDETETETQTLTVLPPPPNGDFEITPAEAKFGETVEFHADETQPDWTHSWRIGDEVSLEGPAVQWTAEDHGLMRVVHTVEGPGGVTRESDRIFIHPPVEIVPETGFSVRPRVFTKGETVTFRADETGEGWKHEWLLGGESAGTGSEWEWESDQTGSISVTHRVRIPDTDAGFEESDEILGQDHDLVQVSFSASPTAGTYPLDVHFTDESIGEAAEYHWDFGDGNVSNERNPVHTYREAGDYSVVLSVTNPQGKVTSNADPVELAVAAPMPLWQKIGLGLVAFLLVWVLLVVPLFLHPLLAPQKGPKLVGIKTYPLYIPARRGWRRYFWPRNTVTIGTSRASDIRLPDGNGARSNVALIGRMPGASSYTIRPLKEAEVFKVEQQTSLTDSEAEERTKITRSRLLKNGDVYEIAGERLAWHQPQPRQATARRSSTKQKPPQLSASLTK